MNVSLSQVYTRNWVSDKVCSFTCSINPKTIIRLTPSNRYILYNRHDTMKQITQKSITIFSLALIASATLCCCLAKQDVAQAQPQQPMSLQQQARHSLASKLMPKARTARSLSDMFDKVKSKIFGNKKGQTSSSASQSSSSMLASASQQSGAQALNSAQRQPWADVSALDWLLVPSLSTH